MAAALDFTKERQQAALYQKRKRVVDQQKQEPVSGEWLLVEAGCAIVVSSANQPQMCCRGRNSKRFSHSSMSDCVVSLCTLVALSIAGVAHCRPLQPRLGISPGSAWLIVQPVVQ